MTDSLASLSEMQVSVFMLESAPEPLLASFCKLQVPGLINVDFADVRAIMSGAGSSLMGQGFASE